MTPLAQYLKDEIQQRILDAALREFASRGFQASRLADIAAAAQISTGNLYRYYSGKEALYEALVTQEFVSRFLKLLHGRMNALKGVQDLRQLEPSAPFHLFKEELLEFCLQNRLKVVLLLAGSQGTRHAGFAATLLEDLVTRAIAHFRHLNPDLRVSKVHRSTLQKIYQSFLMIHTDLLRQFDQPEQFREAVERYSAYHLAGLNGLFGA